VQTHAACGAIVSRLEARVEWLEAGNAAHADKVPSCARVLRWRIRHLFGYSCMPHADNHPCHLCNLCRSAAVGEAMEAITRRAGGESQRSGSWLFPSAQRLRSYMPTSTHCMYVHPPPPIAQGAPRSWRCGRLNMDKQWQNTQGDSLINCALLLCGRLRPRVP
jgi:hypothetical protein